MADETLPPDIQGPVQQTVGPMPQAPAPQAAAEPSLTQRAMGAVDKVKDAWNNFDASAAYSDFKTGFDAGVGKRTTTDNFFSEEYQVGLQKYIRNQRIKEHTGIDVKTNPYAASFGFSNEEDDKEMAEIKKQHPDLPIPTEKDLYDNIAKDAKFNDEYEEVASNGVPGKAGVMAGEVIGSFSDPVNAAVSLVGGWGKMAVTKIATAAGFSFASNFTLQELKGESFREKLGLEHGTQHALESSATAAIGAGVAQGGAMAAGAAIKGIAKGVGKLFGKSGSEVTKDAAKEAVATASTATADPAIQPAQKPLYPSVDDDKNMLETFQKLRPNPTSEDRAIANDITQGIIHRENNIYNPTPNGEAEHFARLDRADQALKAGEPIPELPQLSPDHVEGKQSALLSLRRQPDVWNELTRLDNSSSKLSEIDLQSGSLSGTQKISNLIDRFATQENHPVGIALHEMQQAIDNGIDPKIAGKSFAGKVYDAVVNNQLKATDAVIYKTAKAGQLKIPDVEEVPVSFADRFEPNAEKPNIFHNDKGVEVFDAGGGLHIPMDDHIDFGTIKAASGSFPSLRPVREIVQGINQKRSVASILKSNPNKPIDQAIMEGIQDPVKVRELAKMAKSIGDNMKAEQEKAGNIMIGPEFDQQLKQKFTDELHWQSEQEAIKTVKNYAIKQKVQERLNQLSEGNKENHARASRLYFDDVEARQSTIRGSALSLYANNLEKYAPKYAGFVRPTKSQDNIIRVLYGEKVDDQAATELAKEYPSALDFLWKRANNAGAGIRYKEDFRLPRYTDPESLRTQGQDAFVKDHMEWCDWDKMRRPSDGSMVPPAEREQVLKDIWLTQKSGGLNKEAGRRTSTSDFMRDERFISYKNADSHLSAINKYGGGKTPHQIMLHYIDNMSKYVSGLEMLGPNPYATKEWMKSEVLATAGELEKAGVDTGKVSFLKNPKWNNSQIDALFHHTVEMGEESVLPYASHFVANMKSLAYSALLTMTSAKSVPTDLATGYMATKLSNAPAGRFFKLYWSGLAQNKDLQRTAIRCGIINDSSASVAYGQTRHIGEISTSAFMTRIADISNRLNFLTPMTQAGKNAVSGETLAQLGDNIGSEFSALPPDLLQRFKWSNITENDWNIIRDPLHVDNHPFIPEGRDVPSGEYGFLNPERIRENPAHNETLRNDVADKVQDMMYNRQFAGLIERHASSVALMRGNANPGTIPGLAADTFATFLHYPMSLAHQLHKEMGTKLAKDKLGYAVAAGASLTFSSMMGLQVAQVLSGRDPTSLSNPDLWSRSILTMLPIVDSIYANAGEYGRGVPEAITGPVPSAISDMINLTVGNYKQAMAGKDTSFGPEITRLLKRWSPNINNPLTKAAYDRNIWDRLEEYTDPKAFDKRTKKLSAAYKDQGTSYWYPQATQPGGDLIRLPQRVPNAPSFGSAGTREERKAALKQAKVEVKSASEGAPIQNQIDVAKTIQATPNNSIDNVVKPKYNATKGHQVGARIREMQSRISDREDQKKAGGLEPKEEQKLIEDKYILANYASKGKKAPPRNELRKELVTKGVLKQNLLGSHHKKRARRNSGG